MSTKPLVPMLHLASQHQEVRGPILDRLFRVIEHGQFINGPEVAELEGAIAAHVHGRYAVGCASGTDALLLTLRALDLQPGDEVITTPFTFFATAGAIRNAGGTPVFVDIDPATYLMDPEAARAAVTPRTRALLPVHLYGQMVPMAPLVALAAEHQLAIIEDGAQSFGARQLIGGRWMHAGTVGRFGTLSFFPSKPLGGWGDGGMMLAGDEMDAARLRRLRAHGGAKQYHHEEVGYNSRLDTIQAAVLLAKLTMFERWQGEKVRVAARYASGLEACGALHLPSTAAGNDHAWHQYTVRCRDTGLRDRLKLALEQEGVTTMIYYPTPLHRQPCFAELNTPSLPHAEMAAGQVLSLPMGPHLHPLHQDRIIETILGAVEDVGHRAA